MQVEINEERINSVYLDMFLKGFNDSNVSMLFFYIYSKDLIYDKLSKKWYVLNKYGIYDYDPNNTGYTKKIFSLYGKIDNKYIEIHKNEENDETKLKIKKNYSKGYDFIRKSKNISNMIDFVKPYFERDMGDLFNNVNNKIIAFKNGVYDIEKKIFRLAKPEEYIIITTGYNYKEAEQKYINEVMDILSTIMPNKDNMDYLLKSISLGLLNENITEEFYIWKGCGGNGKGLLAALLYSTLGHYCGTLDINYLAKTKEGQHANAADPQLSSLQYCRLVISTEPEKDINLRTARLKLLSGRDKIKTRELYRDCFEFTPRFNIIIQTNDSPQIDGTDGGIIRRLRKIHFETIFVNSPNPKNKNERKGDPELKNKIMLDEYKSAFFKILVDYYNLFVKEGLIMPQGIKKFTSEYLEENDPVEEFVRENIERTDNQNDKIKSSDMYLLFKNNNSKSIFNQSNFKSTMEKKGFISKRFKNGIYWINCKLIQEDEEDDEEDNEDNKINQRNENE